MTKSEGRRGLLGRRGRTTGRRRTAVVALAILAFLGGSVAVASWLVDGTGPATARAASVVDLTVTAGTPGGALYPGASGGLSAKVSNPNPFPVRLTSASFGAVSTAPLSGRTCGSGNLSVAGPLTLATPVDLPAGAVDVPVTVDDAVTLAASAENGCQGATFTVQLTLSGASA